MVINYSHLPLVCFVSLRFQKFSLVRCSAPIASSGQLTCKLGFRSTKEKILLRRTFFFHCAEIPGGFTPTAWFGTPHSRLVLSLFLFFLFCFFFSCFFFSCFFFSVFSFLFFLFCFLFPFFCFLFSSFFWWLKENFSSVGFFGKRFLSPPKIDKYQYARKRRYWSLDVRQRL